MCLAARSVTSPFGGKTQAAFGRRSLRERDAKHRYVARSTREPGPQNRTNTPSPSLSPTWGEGAERGSLQAIWFEIITLTMTRPEELDGLFEHCVGAQQERFRNRETHGLRSLEIDDELVFRGLLDGHVFWLLAL